MLLFSFSGFSTVQVSPKENSISDSIDSQATNLCRTLFEDLSKIQLTEKDRLNRIEQALTEIEFGNCYYCLYLVQRLITKDDLKEGGRFKGRIDSMTRQRDGCTTLLLPTLISTFDYKHPLEIVDDFSKTKRYDLSNINLYQQNLRWKEEVISATLYSNSGSSAASKYVVDVLSLFKKRSTFSEHRDLLGAVTACNPVDKDIITAVLSQCIYMREISFELSMASPDELYPKYQAELIGLNTVVEWNEYKNEKFNRVSDPGLFSGPIDGDWEGTIDFLNQLLISGFTVVDGE